MRLPNGSNEVVADVRLSAARTDLLSELVVFNVYFPGGIDYSNVKFRAVVWAGSEVLLIISVCLCSMPRASSLSTASYQPSALTLPR